jgi:hypothetical protein
LSTTRKIDPLQKQLLGCVIFEPYNPEKIKASMIQQASRDPDPGKDAETVAVNAIKAVSNSTFGGIMGPVVGGDILGLFGLGGSQHISRKSNLSWTRSVSN